MHVDIALFWKISPRFAQKICSLCFALHVAFLHIQFHHDKLGTSPTKFMVFWDVEWFSLLDVSEEPSAVLFRIEEPS
jgi:hypothetical protein